MMLCPLFRLGIIGLPGDRATALATAHASRLTTSRYGVQHHTRPKAEAFARLAGLSMDNYSADFRRPAAAR